jgi:hypothetical protein
MATKFREIPGLLGRVIAGVLLVATEALGDTVLNVEEIGPWLAANNMPDPHFRLAGAIMLLFAGSVSILVVGYVVDCTRPNGQSPS